MFRGKTQSEARAKFAEYKRQEAAGVVWEQYSFTDWADLWYASHKDNVSATTAEGYKYTLRIMKAHFGEKKISESTLRTTCGSSGRHWRRSPACGC